MSEPAEFARLTGSRARRLYHASVSLYPVELCYIPARPGLDRACVRPFCRFEPFYPEPGLYCFTDHAVRLSDRPDSGYPQDSILAEKRYERWYLKFTGKHGMMKRPYLYSMALLANLLFNVAAVAAEAREITWDDLIPAEAEFDDAFTRLDEDTLFELSMVAGVRDQLEAGREVDEETLANYRTRVEGLESEGVDVDGLIAMREQVTRERIAKTQLANKSLDGKPVRIPGYLLPLEFDGDQVTEFLLVPYVGACIHTPPPPPNQIVHVKTEEAYTLDGGLYTPVWVSGLMKTERSQSNLNFVDGSSDIPSSYALEAISVEPYE